MAEAVGDDFDQLIPHREVSADALKAIEQYNTQQFYSDTVFTQPNSQTPSKRISKSKGKRGIHD